MNIDSVQSRHKARKAIIIKRTVRPRIVDRLIYLAAVAEPLFSLPQAYEVYHNRSAGSVSILSWLGFELMTLIWIWYGIVHKEKTILIYQTLFFLIDGSVMIGAIYYGGKLF